MTKTTRNVVIGMAIAMAAGSTALSEAAEPAIPRVRSSSPALIALIREANERSSTFRGLTDRINASDGIVYVDEGTCKQGVRACLVSVIAAGPNRVLHVTVDIREADWDLMGSIGHELRHVVEVINQPGVTSTDAMYFFYLRAGHRGRTGAFETEAALAAGVAVRSEVRRRVLVAQSW